jgi:hypothetical protein
MLTSSDWSTMANLISVLKIIERKTKVLNDNKCLISELPFVVYQVFRDLKAIHGREATILHDRVQTLFKYATSTDSIPVMVAALDIQHWICAQY